MTDTLTQAAPDSAALVGVPRAQIAPSRFNPRKTFDRGRLDELMESMRTHGFLANFPLLVRPMRGEAGDVEEGAPKYELVCGERRWRASGEVGLDEVWCVVREMDDATALELALVENLQRSDLSPLEEGDGYKQLLELVASDGKLHSVESIAERVGRSVKHIHNRISLCMLRDTDAELALESGELPISHARLIARLPTVDLKNKVTAATLKPPYGPAPLPYSQLQALIREDYMVGLRGAQFDQSQSVKRPSLDDPDVLVWSGSCAACEFNTKNTPEDEERASRQYMCMLPECYRLKSEAAHELWRDTVRDVEAGVFPLPLEQSEEIWSHDGTTLAYNTGYVDLSDKPGRWDLRPGVKEEDAPTWREIVQGQGVPLVLAKDREGAVHELASRELVLEAASQAGCDILRKVEPELTPEQKQAATEKEARERRKADLLNDRLESLIITAILGSKNLPDAYWSAVFGPLLNEYEGYGELDDLAKSIGWSDDSEETSRDFWESTLLGASLSQKMAYLAQLSLGRMYNLERSEALSSLSKGFEIDQKTIKKEIERELAAEEKAARLRAEIEAGMVWSEQRDSDEEYDWNESNVCTNPIHCTLAFPKGVKVSARVFVAKSHKGWHVGAEASVKECMHAGYDPSTNTAAYSNRALALRTGLLEIEEFFVESAAPAKAMDRLQAYLDLLGSDAPANEKGGE